MRRATTSEVLTISATEYCSMMSKCITEYRAVGVDGFLNGQFTVPDDTEAVVGARYLVTQNDHIRVFGTALVLKHKGSSSLDSRVD